MSNDKSSPKTSEVNSFSLKNYKGDLTGWIKDKIDNDAILFAEQFGKHLVDKRLTTSQIRNIYGEVKRIEAKLPEEGKKVPNELLQDFLLLRPKVAYAAKRAGTRGVEDFKEVMDTMHLAVMSVEGTDWRKAFKRFTAMFEAILAYHKAGGGRE